MSLIELSEGTQMVITKIEGGRHVRKKLMDLGIIPGIPVTVIRKIRRNPLILSVLGRQVVLGRGIAAQVYV